MKKYLCTILIIFSVLMVILASCVGADPSLPADTKESDMAAPNTDEAVESGAESNTSAEQITEASPETADVAETETEPLADTEAETEAETTPINKSGDCGNTFWNKSRRKVGQVRLDSVLHVSTQKDYAKNVNKSGNWSVTVSETSGNLLLRGWIGYNFDQFELGWRIGTYSDVPYSTEQVETETREAAVLQLAQKEGYANAIGYVYTLSLKDFKSGDEIHLFIKDTETDTVYCFCELTLNVSALSADLSDPELNEKYGLGYGSTMDITHYDPIEAPEHITAPDDDPMLKLWFDHLTEKVIRYDTSGKDQGRESYTIQMGKNEIEGCQFFLYSPTARKITIKVSDFTNDKGETLTTELGVEYYVEDGYLAYHGYPSALVYPDAVIPYDSYIQYSNGNEHGSYGMDADNKLDYGPYVLIGPFSGSNWDHEKYPFRDSVRGFVIEATTTRSTTPGAYKATVEIYDAESGKCIKAANVYTYVYDVTLSDETALDTAFGLWDIVGIYMHHYNEYPELTRYSDVEITRATADFFLKHRITLTGSLTFFNVMGNEWFKNPRVTSIRMLTKEQFDSIKDDPILAEKMFYYGQDEPGVPRGWRPITWPDGTSEAIYDNTGLLSVLAIGREADQLRDVWGWTDYRMVIPFERILNFSGFNFNSVDKTTGFPAWYDQYAVKDERDSLEYLSKYVNVWTSVFTAGTPRDLASAVIDEQYMQSVQQDQLLGELPSRLTSFKETGGHELWNYVACQPPYTAPYQNILLFNDGTEGRTMFWTTYLNGGTGFLYWHVSYYDAAGNSTHSLRNPFSKTGPGDGILVYPGSAYGQLDPIPSIRLLNMRDGIEDYQLLTMLEETRGEAYTDELVRHIVTSSVTFTRDDDVLYDVRSYLLRALASEIH